MQHSRLEVISSHRPKAVIDMLPEQEYSRDEAHAWLPWWAWVLRRMGAAKIAYVDHRWCIIGRFWHPFSLAWFVVRRTVRLAAWLMQTLYLFVEDLSPDFEHVPPDAMTYEDAPGEADI